MIRAWQIRAGAADERDAAYEIEFHYAANPDLMTMHDLRLEVDGRVAQIDHLLIDRLVGIWICESKHFAEGVAVDDFGEWTGFYRRRPYGIGSPIEQNRKHAMVLADVFGKGPVKPPARLGWIEPTIRVWSLYQRCEDLAAEDRGRSGQDQWTGQRDQGRSDEGTSDKDLDSKGVMAFRRLISQGEVERLARELAARHRPIAIDWAARFGLASEPPAAHEPAPPAASGLSVCQGCGCGSRRQSSTSAGRSEIFGGAPCAWTASDLRGRPDGRRVRRTALALVHWVLQSPG